MITPLLMNPVLPITSATNTPLQLQPALMPLFMSYYISNVAVFGAASSGQPPFSFVLPTGGIAAGAASFSKNRTLTANLFAQTALTLPVSLN